MLGSVGGGVDAARRWRVGNVGLVGPVWIFWYETHAEDKKQNFDALSIVILQGLMKIILTQMGKAAIKSSSFSSFVLDCSLSITRMRTTTRTMNFRKLLWIAE